MQASPGFLSLGLSLALHCPAELQGALERAVQPLLPALDNQTQGAFSPWPGQPPGLLPIECQVPAPWDGAVGHRQKAAPGQAGFRDEPQVSHSHWKCQKSTLEEGSRQRSMDTHAQSEGGSPTVKATALARSLL